MTAVPPAPVPVSPMVPTRWRSTTGLRTALTWLFATDAVAAIGLLVAHAHRAGVISDYKNFSASRSDLMSADDLVGTANGIFAILFLATATVLIIWQWRGAMNNEVLGRIRPRYTPGWSIGAWFIPIANFVIPVRIFQDLWQGADSTNRNFQDWRGLRRWSVIGWWWTFYVAGSVLRFTVSGDRTLDQVRTADRVNSVGSVLLAVAAVLAIFVIRAITDRQETARTERQSNPVAGAGRHLDPTGRFDYRYWDGTTWTDHVSKAGQMVTDPVAGIGGIG